MKTARLAALLLFATLFATLSSPADADELSRHGKRIFYNAKSCFDDLVKDAAYFDGTTLGKKQRNQLVRFHVRLTENVKCLAGKMARLPEQDRGHADYQRYIDRANEFVSYANAMKLVLASQASSEKASDDQCRAFTKAARPHANAMLRWLDYDRGGGHFGGEASAQKHVNALDAVASLCVEDRFVGVGTTGCEWLKLGSAKNDPSQWCSLASRKSELGKKVLASYTKSRLENIGGVSAKDVETRDGWLPIEGPVVLAELSKRGLEKFVSGFTSMKGMATVLGAPDYFDLAELSKPFIARMDKLMAAIRKNAPTYSRPKKRGSSYGVKLAKNEIRTWHKKAKIVSTYQTYGTWKIVKNSLTSIPKERFVKGYVLFRLPGEKLCQLRPWTLTETYNGGGRYQRSLGVRIGYVRWQPCK